jgi:hypothetical protein
LPKNGATPNFIEFKDENENVVASISTSGDLNVTGSITVNGEEVPVGPAFSPATPTFSGPLTSEGVANFLDEVDIAGTLTAATPSFTGPLTSSGTSTFSGSIVSSGGFSAATPNFTGPMTLNGSIVPKITISSATPSGGVNGDVWLVIY